jgi:hypothetical protein
MSATFHLPAAVDQTSRSLAGISTHRLVAMQAECAAWREDMTEFQSGLLSPSARVLWDCLCAGEIPLVLAAEQRIATELTSRITGARTAAA